MGRQKQVRSFFPSPLVGEGVSGTADIVPSPLCANAMASSNLVLTVRVWQYLKPSHLHPRRHTLHIHLASGVTRDTAGSARLEGRARRLASYTNTGLLICIFQSSDHSKYLPRYGLGDLQKVDRGMQRAKQPDNCEDRQSQSNLDRAVALKLTEHFEPRLIP
jgi:hypothetical protein